MKLKKVFSLLAFTIGLLVGAPGYVVAAVDWEIYDGAPDYWMSPAIVVRHQGDEVFDVDSETPPDPSQSPIYGQTNYVWVLVRLNGSFDGGQEGKLRLFVGRSGTPFIGSDYDLYLPGINPNVLDPPESPEWTVAEWDTNLTGVKVSPLRTLPALDLEYNLTDGGPYTPGPTGFKWIRFIWEPYLIPPVGGQYSLVAYIYDPDDYTGGDVPSNNNLAECWFIVIGDGDGGCFITTSHQDVAQPTLLDRFISCLTELFSYIF